jgi:hypothetical protein
VKFDAQISNTITLGCGDIVDYATISKYLTFSSLTNYNENVNKIIIDQNFNPNIENSYFGAFVSTAIPSSLFSLETYKIQNLTIYLFFIFMLPLIFLISYKIFNYTYQMAVIVTALCGLNFQLLFIIYQGFLGQIIGMGYFYCLFFLILYALHKNQNFSSLRSYIPLISFLLFGLVITYVTLAPLFIVPIILYILYGSYSKKFLIPRLELFKFLFVTGIITILIFPTIYFTRIEQLFFFRQVTAGWEMPLIFPHWVFGLVGNSIIVQNLYYSSSVNLPVLVLLSVPIVVISIYSFKKLHSQDQRLYYLSAIYISFVVVCYLYYYLESILSVGFNGDSYKSFKLLTYFIPLILIICLTSLKDFKIIPMKTGSYKQFCCILIIFCLILVNIWSAIEISQNNYNNCISISDDILSLERVDSMNNVTSINILEPPWFNQMWSYYFLFSDKKVYLKYASYFPATPLYGEWDLLKESELINYPNVSVSEKYTINDNYLIIKNSSHHDETPVHPTTSST